MNPTHGCRQLFRTGGFIKKSCNLAQEGGCRSKNFLQNPIGVREQIRVANT